MHVHINTDEQGITAQINFSDAKCKPGDGVNISETALQESHVVNEVFCMHHHTKMVIVTSISEEHVAL
jgi:hypothetical protein